MRQNCADYPCSGGTIPYSHGPVRRRLFPSVERGHTKASLFGMRRPERGSYTSECAVASSQERCNRRARLSGKAGRSANQIAAVGSDSRRLFSCHWSTRRCGCTRRSPCPQCLRLLHTPSLGCVWRCRLDGIGLLGHRQTGLGLDFRHHGGRFQSDRTSWSRPRHLGACRHRSGRVDARVNCSPPQGSVDFRVVSQTTTTKIVNRQCQVPINRAVVARRVVRFALTSEQFAAFSACGF